jgi:ATP synthase F1 delta subunit
MIVLESQLAKKYAIAFLNVCDKESHVVHLEVISAFYDFTTSNKVFQAILNLPSLPMEKKHKIIKHVSEKLYLCQNIKKLVFLLLKDKRIDMLDEILKKIILFRKQKLKKYHFSVSVSHKVTEDEKNKIIKFITSLVNTEITTSFIVDVSLIGGIKIKGNTFLWERSIAKQLREIEQKILRRE